MRSFWVACCSGRGHERCPASCHQGRRAGRCACGDRQPRLWLGVASGGARCRGGLRVGYTDVVVAGGTESMSNAPFVLKARGGDIGGARRGVHERFSTASPLRCTSVIWAPAEEVASKYNVSRSEQDAFAAESQRRAAEAIADGRFDEEIVRF